MREPSEPQSVSGEVSRVRASDRTESFGGLSTAGRAWSSEFPGPGATGCTLALCSLGGAKAEARAVGSVRGAPWQPNQAGCPHRLWPRWSARRHASCGGRLRCCQSAAPIDGSSCRTGRLREREAEPLDRTVQSAKSGPAGELWESPGHFWAEPIPTADCRGLPC